MQQQTYGHINYNHIQLLKRILKLFLSRILNCNVYNLSYICFLLLVKTEQNTNAKCTAYAFFSLLTDFRMLNSFTI